MFKKVYIMYCPVCGYVDGEHTKTVCPFCGRELSDSNHLLKEMRGKFRWEIEPIAEDIFQNLVKDNPEFDNKAYQFRVEKQREETRRADAIAKKKWDEQMAKGREILAERAANAPRCPTCGSTDLKKIDALDRAISVSFLGLASGKIGKSFKCNHCGYIW